MNPSNWRFYVVTPTLQKKSDYERIVKETILGGADVVQFRAENLPCTRTVQGLSDRDYYQIGKNLRQLTKKYKVPLIVNNRLDLALAIGADGLHLGQTDLPVVEVKKLLSTFRPASAKATAGGSLIAPRFVIGVSTHSLAQALQAEKDGADYISIGPIFSTPLKPDYKPVGLEIISQIKKKIKIPFFAIGGINQNNVREVISAGAERIAVIRAIFAEKNIGQRTKELKDNVTSHKFSYIDYTDF